MRHQNKFGGSNGDRPQIKITTEQALWLAAVRQACIAFIKNQDDNLTWEDAEDIFTHQMDILSKRGFHDLYSNKILLEIRHGRVLSDSEKLAYLHYHLRRRIIDHFRRLRSLKAGYVRLSCTCGNTGCNCPQRKGGHERCNELSEHEWANIVDERSKQAALAKEVMMALNEIFADAWPFLGKTYRAIIRAAKRYPAGGFNPTCLYEAMMEHERGFFMPKDGALVVNEREFIRRAIAKRTSELRKKLQRIVADEPGRLDFF